MTSLSAHLRRPDDHAQLPFHPQCPLCRQERLSGRLLVEPLVSRRTQAAMTAGLLALTSVAPTAAFAAEGDREGEGGAEPAAIAPADVDLGPEDPDLGEDAGAAPADDGDDVPPASPPAGTAPAPSTPAATTPAASAPTPKSSAPTAKAPRATPPAAAPAPTAPAPASAAADGAPTANAAPPGLPAESAKPAAELPEAFGDRQAVAAPRQGTPRAAQPHRRVKLGTPRQRLVTTKRRTTVATVGPAPAADPAPAAPSANPAPVAAPATSTAPVTARRTRALATPAHAARRGDEFHVVGRGESLWSIAGDLVGEDASPARVAREVNRLWTANRDRIATGNPDLLLVGTKLDLR